MRQAIIWTNDGLAYWRMYASLGLIELTDPNARKYGPLTKMFNRKTGYAIPNSYGLLYIIGSSSNFS